MLQWKTNNVEKQLVKIFTLSIGEIRKKKKEWKMVDLRETIFVAIFSQWEQAARVL